MSITLVTLVIDSPLSPTLLKILAIKNSS